MTLSCTVVHTVLRQTSFATPAVYMLSSNVISFITVKRDVRRMAGVHEGVCGCGCGKNERWSVHMQAAESLRDNPLAARVYSHRPPPRPPPGVRMAMQRKTQRPEWQASSRQGLGPPRHRPPPRLQGQARHDATIPVDQQMRISIAEQVIPELYQNTATAVSLRAQNLKLKRQVRQLETEISRLEAAACAQVDAASLTGEADCLAVNLTAVNLTTPGAASRQSTTAACWSIRC